jgi:hypothetical protein
MWTWDFFQIPLSPLHLVINSPLIALIEIGHSLIGPMCVEI